MINIAVVILNWNGINFLKKFLPTLIKYSSLEGVKIFIADNGSQDDSVSFTKKNYPEINIIQFDKNYGFAEGYNKALYQIEAKYFVILNSDVEVTENWISPLIELMENDDNIAACMPKIKSYSNNNFFEYAGAAGGFIDKFGYPFCRGRILSNIEEDKGQYDDTKEIFWATGACMFVRANLYKRAGGFDGFFFAHMEEIDLCWRLKNMGYKIMYSPKSTIYHVGGGTLPNNNPHKLFLNYRNNLILLYKNLPSNKLFIILFLRLILDCFSATIYLLNFQFRYFFSVVKAHFSFLSSLTKYRAKRLELLKFGKKFKHNEILNHSIVFDFFFKKMKKFSQLKLNK
jgi:GT2 family glycosyltransferase